MQYVRTCFQRLRHNQPRKKLCTFFILRISSDSSSRLMLRCGVNLHSFFSVHSCVCAVGRIVGRKWNMEKTKERTEANSWCMWFFDSLCLCVHLFKSRICFCCVFFLFATCCILTSARSFFPKNSIVESRVDKYDTVSEWSHFSSTYLFYFHGQLFALLCVLPFCRFFALNDLHQMQMLLLEFFFLQQHFAETIGPIMAVGFRWM